MIIKPAHITPATLNKRLLGTEEEAKSANLVEQRQRTLIQYWMGSSGLLSLSDWSVPRAAIESFLRRSKSLANLKRNNQIKSDSLKMLKCNKPCIEFSFLVESPQVPIVKLAQATSARNVDSLLLLLLSPRGVPIDLHSLIVVLELLGLLL